MEGFGKYLRRPDPVFARQITSEQDVEQLMAAAAPVRLVRHPVKSTRVLGWNVVTAHGDVDASFGDWLLTDGKGDYWPVRDKIFRERYVEPGS